MGHGLEAHGYGAEVEVHIGHDLAGLHGNGVQSEAVVVAGQQIGGQHLIIRHVVGLIQNPVSQTGAVSSGGQHCGIGDIGGDAVVPVEGLQRHIAGVRHRNVITHLAAGHDLGIAPLGDGHAQRRGLVVGGELDDLACVFQRHVMDGGIELPVRGSLDFTNLVASQGQGFTGGHPTGIGSDVIHDFAAAGIDDLKDRTCQRRAGCSARDLVILGSILVNLDLAGDGFVLPFDFDSLASSDIDRLHLGVHIVALILQFTNIVAAGLGQASDIHPAVLVRFILADGVLITVVEQEGHAIDALARGAVDLMDQNAGQGLILNGERGGLAVLHLEIMRRVVQFKSIRTFDFNGIVVAIFQREEGTAIFIGGHRIHKAVIRTTDLELHIGDALGLFVGIDFDDLNAADGIIVEIQALRVVGVHNHSLGAGLLMDGVARDTLHLRHDDGAGDPIDLDDALLVGPVQPVGGELTAIGINHTTVSVGDLELDTLQRGLRYGILLVDDETAERLVEELQNIGLVVLDLNGLGCIVQQVPLRRLYFRHDDTGRLHIGDGDITPFVSAVLTARVAHSSTVRSGHTEDGTRQRLLSHGIHLLDDKIAQGSVLESDFLALSALNLDGVNGIVQQVAVLGLGLKNFIAAAGDTLQMDGAVAVSGVGSCGILAAVTAGNFEFHTTQRLLSNAVHLGNEQRTVGVIVEGEGLGVVRIDHHSLGAGLGVDAVIRQRLLFRHDQCADYIGEDDLPVGIGHIGALGGELTALGIHIGAIGIGDFELNALQGLAGDGIQFVDDQVALGLVPEL